VGLVLTHRNSDLRRPRTPSPPHHRRRRSHRPSRSYPPPPSVEDEVASLAKEHPKMLHDKGGEVCMRGTVDQEPIIIDLENTAPKQEESKAIIGERKIREKQKAVPPPLKLDVEANVYDRRQPSPYSYTRTPRTPSNRLSAEFFMSPGPLTPPATVPRSDAFKGPIDSRAKRSSSRAEYSDESDVDSKQTARLRSRRTTPRVSFAESDAPAERRPNRYSSDHSDREDKRTRARQSRSETTRPSLTIPRSNPSESEESYYQRKNAAPSSASSSRVMPVPTAHARSGRSESLYTSRPSEHECARSTSSLVDAPVFFPTPPASPTTAARNNSKFCSSIELHNLISTSHFGVRINCMKLSGDSSRASISSRPGSRPTSRPTSPLMSPLDLNQESYMSSRSASFQTDRSSTYPQSIRERSSRLPTSKLTSSTRQQSVDNLREPPRIDIKSPSPGRSPLPYPVDEPHLMPSHEMYQVGPVPTLYSQTSSESSSSSLFLPKPQPSQRPNLPSRHSVAESIPKVRMEPPRTASTNVVPQNDLAPSPMQVPISLPSCPRKEFSRKYDDWYQLEGNPDFDVCPTCLDEIIRPTPFKRYFKRAPPRSSTVRSRCDFGSPWVRLAWLLTLKEQRQNINPIYAVAAVTNTEPECPGSQEAMGCWYSLEDEFGALMPYLTICQRDKKNLEALFPSLTGVLVRLPSSSSRSPSTCSMRTDSRRFPKYLDLLVEIDERARFKSRATPTDLKPLIDLVRSNAFKSECKRDRIVLDHTWHYMPSLPALSICEECYDDAVLPAIKQGSGLASKFNRVLMPLPPALENSGCSCQLYSPRMRKVWDRALRRSDEEGLSYLARKVNERRDVELDLRRQQVEIKRLLDRSSKGYSGGVDREWLRKELERIEKEWADWE
jgi:hypothetical protein